MTNLVNFRFEGREVRTVEIDGEPWFVARDVAVLLGYIDPHGAVRKHCKGALKRTPLWTPGGNQEVRIISESDVMRLIVSSQLQDAELFERWIFDEVLPSIRKTGSYSVQKTDAEIVAQGLIAANNIIESQKRQLKAAKTLLIEQEPKVRYADAVGERKDCVLIRTMAKILNENGYKTGERRFFDTLRQDGYLCSTGHSRNEPTQRAMDMGLFHLKETAITHYDGHITTSITPKITGKGQLFFFKKYTGKTGEIVNGEVHDSDSVLPPEVGGNLNLEFSVLDGVAC